MPNQQRARAKTARTYSLTWQRLYRIIWLRRSSHMSEMEHLRGLGPWGLQAAEHWRKHLPRLYRTLQMSGELRETLLRAETNAVNRNEQLMRQGTSAEAARELALAEFIFR